MLKQDEIKIIKNLFKLALTFALGALAYAMMWFAIYMEG